jgi:hypothetical protein
MPETGRHFPELMLRRHMEQRRSLSSARDPGSEKVKYQVCRRGRKKGGPLDKAPALRG